MLLTSLAAKSVYLEMKVFVTFAAGTGMWQLGNRYVVIREQVRGN